MLHYRETVLRMTLNMTCKLRNDVWDYRSCCIKIYRNINKLLKNILLGVNYVKTYSPKYIKYFINSVKI